MLTHSLLERVLANDWLAALDPPARRLALRELLTPDELADAGAADAIAEAAEHVDGYGLLAEVMARPGVTDVLVNGPRDVWVEQDGALHPAAVEWPDAAALRDFLDRLLARGGASVDASTPMADARLPDGTRIHVVLPPIAPHGPLASIRRFPSVRFALGDLVRKGMVSETQAAELRDLVRSRTSVVVSGATGSGKTTLLNALVALIDAGERVVTIEETPELGPFSSHVVALTARPPNVEGAGGVDLHSLVRASLRMRPDRIVVGEVRGREAEAALAAMATGHDGSMLTVHARSAAEAPDRLAYLGGTDAAAVRRSVGAFVHLARSEGIRRVAEIRCA